MQTVSIADKLGRVHHAVESLASVAQAQKATSTAHLHHHDAPKAHVDAPAIHASSHAEGSNHASAAAAKQEHESHHSRHGDDGGSSSSKVAAAEKEKASLHMTTSTHHTTGTGILGSVELAVQDLTRYVCACVNCLV
jgi:hypothetical protein